MEEEHPRLVSKGPRSTGLVEDCAGGQGAHWTVPDMMMMMMTQCFHFILLYSTEHL